MSLMVYNSQSKTKEAFAPLTGKKVNAYVCGITAYDFSHIGHARSAVVFDVIVKYLRYSGYEVRFVRNYTDIDDKIIRRATEEHSSWDIISNRYIREFKKDMSELGVSAPDFEPKATEYIPHMIRTIQTLLDKDHAYVSEGNVYFSVKTFPFYGKLSGRDLDEMIAGARVELDPHKRYPLDFALWKHAKEGEPRWDSPWGEGRPGWHIECSVMSTALLGPTLDIHGGGMDLVFPHHENEIAQAEAATGQPFVRYWLHNGFVNINQEKMSKSLGNILTIRDLLNRYHPETIRMFLLSKHYRNPLDYSEEAMQEAEVGMERLYQTVRRAEEARISDGLSHSLETDPGEACADLAQKTAGIRGRFQEAMDDDFNTARAIGYLFETVKAINRLLDARDATMDERDIELLRQSCEELRSLAAILGLIQAGWQDFIHFKTHRTLEKEGLSTPEIERLVLERTEARTRRDWARADEIRRNLNEKGILLEDSREGTTWRVA